MKKQFINTRYSLTIQFIFGLLIITLFISSCNKEVGPPVIKSVRLTDPATAGMSLPGANLEAWIVIQGENFTGLKSVEINGIEVFVNTSYVSDNNIVLQIPAETPNMGTSPGLEGYIKITTQYGEVIYEFDIYAPPAITNHISNEFAKAGDTIILSGKFFFLVDSVIFPGNLSGEIISSSDDGSTCSVIVPSGIIESGPLRVRTLSGISESNTGILFNDTTGMMCDFDNKNFWEGWGGTVVNTSSHSVLPDFMGQAFFASLPSIGPVSWWVQDFAMPVMSGEYPIFKNNTSAQNLAVKFEYFAKGPWNAGYYNFQLVKRDTVWSDATTYTLEWAEVYTYQFQPWWNAETQVKTDIQLSNWQTIVIPLNKFKLSKENFTDYSGEERLIQTFADIKGFNYFGMYFVNPGQVEIKNLAIGVDNIRMVEYKP